MIVGAGGQLGSELQKTCPPGVRVVAVTRSELDIADEAAVATLIEREAPGLVINAAAYTQKVRG